MLNKKRELGLPDVFLVLVPRSWVDGGGTRGRLYPINLESLSSQFGNPSCHYSVVVSVLGRLPCRLISAWDCIVK